MVSAMKDIFEDMKRHKSDSVENYRGVLKLETNEKNFKSDKWKNLIVG
jgi:hypothetical protein